jgi:hypothetical protein
MTCDMSPRAKVFLATGSILSHRLDPGIRVKAITLAGKYPALQFIPDRALINIKRELKERVSFR